jgi:hypothetical protein
MNEKWYIKNSNGKAFGPITLEVLKDWVKDGRVEPLAGISKDLKTWMLAPLKAELEMNWVVENNPGQFYGPTHRNVIDDLVRSGSLSPSARFYCDDRGSSDSRLRDLEKKISEMEKTIASKEMTILEMQKVSKQKDAQAEELQKVVQQCEVRINDFTSALRQKDVQMSAKDMTISEKDKQLFEKDTVIAAKEAEIRVCTGELAKKDSEIAELKVFIAKEHEIHERQWESPEVLLPEVISDEVPPPVSHKAFSRGSQLADLERQAQQELARIGANGVADLFNRKR